jgi:putative transcriptional regulator
MTIKEMRSRMGYTQQAFGDLLNIPKRTIENWEYGKNKCPEYVRKLIQYYLFKEEYIMNTKITFVSTSEYNDSIPNNNFPEETEYIITDGVYDFEDYLRDNGVNFEEDENTEGFYWVLDDDDKRTGAAFMILKIEDTDEDLI